MSVTNGGASRCTKGGGGGVRRRSSPSCPMKSSAVVMYHKERSRGLLRRPKPWTDLAYTSSGHRTLATGSQP
eukprot:4336172-Alexandrium_andersonii.AAC.1